MLRVYSTVNRVTYIYMFMKYVESKMVSKFSVYLYLTDNTAEPPKAPANALKDIFK